jgi:hypothetical protein
MEGENFKSLTAFITLERLASLTVPILLITLETVVIDTPLARATSIIEAFLEGAFLVRVIISWIWKTCGVNKRLINYLT